MKLNHYIGGIFLVSGTTIGAGILALPVMTGVIGFFPSLLIFGLVWLVMLSSSFFFLDVNLAFKDDVNFISMAGKTLGRVGQGVNWIFYLLLLYSLTAAYIAGSAPLFAAGIEYLTGWAMPAYLSYFCLPVIFGWFVYAGTEGVDAINRVLMIGLLLTYVLIVVALPSHIQEEFLRHVDWKPSLMALLVIITSFGYHIIIPSLTAYMNHDKKHLRWTLFLGSLMPLVIYVLWELVTLGVVPITELALAWQKGVPVSLALSKIVHTKWVQISIHFFAFFTIVTSFLGVSLSLSDFLTDGFSIKKTWEGRLMACLLTFVPPLIFLFSYSRGFILALEYAGALVAVLLIILPALMAWNLKEVKFYQTPIGRAWLVLIICFGLGVVGVDIFQQFGVFKPFYEHYVPTK